MANRAGLGISAAAVVMALLAAMLVVGDAEAGRPHRHHDSPPAPPGFNEPMAAPSPYFRGEPSASPAHSPVGFPFANAPEAAGPGGSHSRMLSGSDNFAASPFADSPFAFGVGPAPESGC